MAKTHLRPVAEREGPPFREVPRPNHPGLVSLFSNGEYIVQKWHGHPDLDHQWRFAIKRKDGQPVHDWMVVQRIKIVGPERVAVEVFPSNSN